MFLIKNTLKMFICLYVTQALVWNKCLWYVRFYWFLKLQFLLRFLDSLKNLYFVCLQFNKHIIVTDIEHGVQTDPAKNVWTWYAFISPKFGTEPDCKKARRRSEFCLFICFLHELGGNNCFINHFLLSDETFWLWHRILIEK